MSRSFWNSCPRDQQGGFGAIITSRELTGAWDPVLVSLAKELKKQAFADSLMCNCSKSRLPSRCTAFFVDADTSVTILHGVSWGKITLKVSIGPSRHDRAAASNRTSLGPVLRTITTEAPLNVKCPGKEGFFHNDDGESLIDETPSPDVGMSPKPVVLRVLGSPMSSLQEYLKDNTAYLKGKSSHLKGISKGMRVIIRNSMTSDKPGVHLDR